MKLRQLIEELKDAQCIVGGDASAWIYVGGVEVRVHGVTPRLGQAFIDGDPTYRPEPDTQPELAQA